MTLQSSRSNSVITNKAYGNRRGSIMERILSMESTTGNADLEPPQIDPLNSVSSVIGFGGLAAPRIRRSSSFSATRLVTPNQTVIGEDEDRSYSIVSIDENAVPAHPEDELPNVSFSRVAAVGKKELPFTIIALLASVAMGAVMPAYAYIFGEVVNILGKDIDEARSHSVTLSMAYIGLGLSMASVTVVQLFMFQITSEKLVRRLRVMSFTYMLKQEMGWFDRGENCTGHLLYRLAGDTEAVRGVGDNRNLVYGLEMSEMPS